MENLPLAPGDAHGEPEPKLINRTALRHRLLAAVDNGEITSIVSLIWLPTQARRSIEDMRDHGLVTCDTKPHSLTESGRELLAAWNDKHGEVSK